MAIFAPAGKSTEEVIELDLAAAGGNRKCNRCACRCETTSILALSESHSNPGYCRNIGTLSHGDRHTTDSHDYHQPQYLRTSTIPGASSWGGIVHDLVRGGFPYEPSAQVANPSTGTEISCISRSNQIPSIA